MLAARYEQTFCSVKAFQHTRSAKMDSAARAQGDAGYVEDISLHTFVAVRDIRALYHGRHRKSCQLYEPCMRRLLNDDIIRHMRAQVHLEAARKLWLSLQLNYLQELSPPFRNMGVRLQISALLDMAIVSFVYHSRRTRFHNHVRSGQYAYLYVCMYVCMYVYM